MAHEASRSPKTLVCHRDTNYCSDGHVLHHPGLGVDRRKVAVAVAHLQVDLVLHAYRGVGTNPEGAHLAGAFDVTDRRVIGITDDDRGAARHRVDELHCAAVLGIAPDNLDAVVLTRLEVSRPLDDFASGPLVGRRGVLADRLGVSLGGC